MERQKLERIKDFAGVIDSLGVDQHEFQIVFGMDIQSFSRYGEDVSILLWAHDEDYHLVYGNTLFLKTFGSCLDKPCYKSLRGKKKPCHCCQSRKALTDCESQRCILCKKLQDGVENNTFHWPIKSKERGCHVLKSSFCIDDSPELFKDFFSTRTKQPAGKKTFLTSCSVCKRFKDKQNNWVDVGGYLLAFFSKEISHGLCPTCVGRLYPDLKISIGYG